jgi:hypothetical protein
VGEETGGAFNGTVAVACQNYPFWIKD